MFKGFKEFITKGNAFDLAIGIIIGAAFSKIVASLVADIITPFLGVFTGGINFKNLVFVLKEANGDIPALTVNYGNFIQTGIDFLVIAISVYMFIKFVETMKKRMVAEKQKEEVLKEDPKDVKLLE
ncbi:MAG: large conductance mechanosensitive channel protein MscL, partial [Fusobacteriaceae bacterium]